MRSMAEMDEMINHLVDLETDYDEKKAASTAAHKAVDDQYLAIQAELVLQGVTSFKGNLGLASLVNKHNVKFPTSPEPREALKYYLEKNNAFDNMWSINYAKLNGWYKEEVARLEEDNEMPDVPGLNPVTEVTLSFRRSK